MTKRDEKIKEEEELEDKEKGQSGKEAKGIKNDKVEELEQKVEEAENNYKRALADYQNLQKRVQEEKIDWIKAANKELLLRVLPVLDTLMLANKHVENEGLKVSIQQFIDTLKAEGVTKVKTEGEQFNPHLMECIVTEEGEDGKVLEEIRSGYMMYDKILRPAQVKVGKGK
jgi:molecular chaperone GrpE